MSAHAPFWVELLGKDGEVISRQRISVDAIAIGRGYENDLIVDDPFVAPLHLRIGYDTDGLLWIDDLVAGLATTRMRVNGEATIHIGHTAIRVRTAAFSVPPALPMAIQPISVRDYALRALACAAALIGLTLLTNWLSQTAEFKLANYLPEGVLMPLLALGWAGIWALVTRTMTTRTQFTRHAFIVFAALLTLLVATTTAGFLDYAIAWSFPQRWLSVLGWCIVGAMLFAHIAVIAPRRNRLAGTIVAAMVLLAIGVNTSLRWESEKVKPQHIAVKLLPPYLLLKRPTTADAYFKEVDALKAKLDDARKKEPTSGGSLFDDLD